MLGFGVYRRWVRGDPRRLGRWGERRVRRHLRRKGWRILARNWRHEGGELDVVAADPQGVIVFVEVKSRRDEMWAQAQDAVGPEKRRHLTHLAQSFVRAYKIKDRPLRFDVVAVVLPESGPVELRHYENAFRP